MHMHCGSDSGAPGQRPSPMPAQGNALGLRPHRSKALKGRSPVAPLQTIISLTLVLSQAAARGNASVGGEDLV